MKDNQGIIIRCQGQKWPKFDRVVIAAIDPFDNLMGTVQLELYPKKKRFGASAYLYALWVGADYRRAGVAAALMHDAETIAADRGHKAIALEWSVEESPMWVCQWYARLGYDEKEFTPGYAALMIKKI